MRLFFYVILLFVIIGFPLSLLKIALAEENTLTSGRGRIPIIITVPHGGENHIAPELELRAEPSLTNTPSPLRMS